MTLTEVLTMVDRKKLESHLRRRGWLKKDFARRCHITPAQLSCYLSGRHGVGVETQNQMQFVLKCQFEDLFFLQERLTGAKIQTPDHNLT